MEWKFNRNIISAVANIKKITHYRFQFDAVFRKSVTIALTFKYFFLNSKTETNFALNSQPTSQGYYVTYL